MRDRFKWILAALTTISVLILAAVFILPSHEPDSLAMPTQGESLAQIRFELQLDRGETTPLRFWGDGNSLYYYFLPSGCSPEDLVVHTRLGITLRREGQDSWQQHRLQDGDRLSGIVTETIYQLGYYDDTQSLYEVPVIFVASQNIHSLHITTDTGDLQPVLNDKSNQVSGSLLLADSEGHTRFQGSLEYLRGRGNGSWYSYKKPFNLKLNRAADLLGTGPAKRYCLLSQEQDMSCLRNYLAFHLARQGGLPATPDCIFADLWIDGFYYGLYLMTDQVDISPASVDIPDLEHNTEMVNQLPLSQYPSVLSPDGQALCQDIPNDPKNITGGYLLEVDHYYTQNKAAWFNSSLNAGITFKSPKYVSPAQLDYVRSLILDMEKAISTPDSTAYRDYLDEDSWAAMGVLQELMVNNDFMGSSQFFFKEPDPPGGRSLLYAGPIWDMDQTLGPLSRSYVPANSFMLPSRAWYDKLYLQPTFHKRMVELYQDVYRPLVQTLLDSTIDSMAVELSPAARMNFIRWGTVALNATGLQDPFQSEVYRLKDYLRQRVEFLDDYCAHPEQYHVIRISKDLGNHYGDYYYRQYMVRHGDPLPQPADPNTNVGIAFRGWFYGPPDHPGAPVEFDVPVTEDLTFSAAYFYVVAPPPAGPGEVQQTENILVPVTPAPTPPAN